MKAGTVLLKQQLVVITWKKLYLVLCNDGVLQFFKEEGGPIKDVFRLDADCEICEAELITITNKKYCFMITGREKYTICVESQAELDEWLQAIQQLIQHIKMNNSRNINSNNTINNNSNNNTLDNNSNSNINRDINNINQDINYVNNHIGITICSYNVNFALVDPAAYGSEESDNMFAMLSTKADVIFLQETNDDWETYIRHKTTIFQEYKYYCFHPAELPPGGIAVLSKYPITNKELIKSPVNWFPAQFVIVHAPNQDIQVLNLHLRPPLTTFPNPLPLPHAYLASKKDRVVECMTYSAHVNFNSPLVVLGDFNEDVTADSVRVWSHKLGLKNAYDKFIENNNTNNIINDANNITNTTSYESRRDITWHWELPLNITVKAKFDHILYYGLECAKYGVKLDGASDHYPIFAHFLPVK